MDRRRTIVAGGAAVAAAGLATLVRALWVEPRATKVRRVTLRLPHWPQELDGLRVALVGDVHAGAPHVDVARVQRLARQLRKRKPELLLLAGDLVDAEVALGTDVPPGPVAQALASIGVPRAAVLGNHDHAYGTADVAKALRDAGFALLHNETHPVELRGTTLHVVGVADDFSDRPDPQQAFAAVPPNAPVVCLTHSPDVFPRIPDRAALTVAGHTHGGQVAIPGIRARIIPSRHGERYAGGHVVERGRHLFITTGLGTSRWPIRLGAPAEAVVLTLKPQR